jgi:hypothetical protein
MDFLFIVFPRRIWGSYLYGIFDSDPCRRWFSHRLPGAACALGTILILLLAVATVVIYCFS